MATQMLCSEINTADNSDRLVRPKVALRSLLRLAGADKEVFTMKEVLFYLGQYIMQKQLFDPHQQHIVHCSSDPLGSVLGVDSFSVKEPRVLFSMLTRNLVTVKNPDSQTGHTEPNGPDRAAEGTESDSSSSSDSQTSSRRRRRRSTDPGSFRQQEEEDDEGEPRKRHKSDSFSLTFDQSLSWCVIGGLSGDRTSEESDAHSVTTEVSSLAGELVVQEVEQDSDSDNFSVEFEVESIDSDAYSQDGDLSDEDQVFEVTIFEAEDEDSFDDDTEITAADYWKCSKCDELNPPLPRNCNRCWTLRPDWFAESVASDAAPLNPGDLEAPPPETCSPDQEGGEGEGLDMPDGKRAKTPLISDASQDSHVSAPSCQSPAPSCQSSAPNSQSSAFDTQSSSQCGTLDSQELGGSQPSTSSSCSSVVAPAWSGPGGPEQGAPELERFNSAEAMLPASCLEPCLICQSRPKNGCIVHGRTGHLMACYPCARKLQRRNKLCPVCRQPIQSVVLTYLS